MFQWLNRLDQLFPIRYSVWFLCVARALSEASSPGSPCGTACG